MLEKRWYIRLGNLGFNLILLNILWITFSLLGLIVFGFFPSTVALFAVIRKFILEDEDIPVLPEFIKQFKNEFMKSNLMGYSVTFIGVFLFLDFKIVQQISNDYLQMMMFNLILVIGIFYAISILYIFPLYVHFDFKLIQYFRYACILTIARPFHTIMLIAFLGAILFIYMYIPALILLFGISLFCFVVMKIAALSFPRKQGLKESY
ncbi:DUF624 domain-containing protein [Gracilibacillus salitolerans]|uniref:DUF624 domain-containing protein n=1 Tax=Gracilibacillus salitolerans TaxID=2663022 RepID=A0A5Q2TPJ4_9BACI|nr:DUF624 domain-containing protein [Gracilibacillus salitolerans]QGH36027.1 DUF624 domain-containing protein [Gracilibacillus salitolerans]